MRRTDWNQATRVVPASARVALPPPDLRTLFVRAYPSFADPCRAIDVPGLALVAIDEVTGTLAGVVHLRAAVGHFVTSIIGRHDHCDLHLAIPGNDSLALRQLAVVISPLHVWRPGSADVRYRILDLRTSDGMLDEHGRALRGLRAEGPAIVRCAGYALYALPLGDPTDWPASAEDAWAYLPERVYFDELPRVPDGSIVDRPVGARDPHITVVTRLRGPVDTAMQLVSEGDIAGRLRVDGPTGGGTIDIGHKALRDGVLLGRYTRCDAHGYCDDQALSRVHALLLLVDDRLHLIDIASTNGTRELGGADARVLGVTDATGIELGTNTTIRWSWTS